MQKWEYTFAYINASVNIPLVVTVNGVLLEKKQPFTGGYGPPLYPWLQMMGEDGWELVSASEHTSNWIRMFFKRPKP